MELPDGLDVTIAAALLACSFAGSMITAGVGAGGGVFLLSMMAIWLPPIAVIPVHGLVQLGSNVGRASMTWRHIRWYVIAAFLPGALVGAVLGSLLLVRLPATAWQLLISVFVLYLCWGPRLPRVVLSVPGIIVAAGLTSFASLFVGATGPLVAAFLRQIDTDRFTTVATFAAAMIIQHAPKALVFGLAGFAFAEWLPLAAGMIAAGLVGTWLGVRLLRRLDNRQFGRIFNVVLSALALRLLWLGVSGWLAGHGVS